MIRSQTSGILLPAIEKKGSKRDRFVAIDTVDRSQSRSLEQLMDQDSINIDNGENQVDKRARVLE